MRLILGCLGEGPINVAWGTLSVGRQRDKGMKAEGEGDKSSRTCINQGWPCLVQSVLSPY